MVYQSSGLFQLIPFLTVGFALSAPSPVSLQVVAEQGERRLDTFCTTVKLLDSYGDGWHGGSLQIKDSSSILVAEIGETTFLSGSIYSESLCLGGGCYTAQAVGTSYLTERAWTIQVSGDSAVLASTAYGDNSVHSYCLEYDMVCPAGQEPSSNTTCRDCPIDTWSDEISNSFCTPCINSFNTEGNTGSTSNTCVQGNLVCTTVNLLDSVSDGWHGGSLQIKDSSFTLVAEIGETTFLSGSTYSESLCLGGGCYTAQAVGTSYIYERSWNIQVSGDSAVLASTDYGDNSVHSYCLEYDMVCPVGQEPSSDFTCRDCPEDTYSDESSASFCTPCGYGGSTDGLTGSDSCSYASNLVAGIVVIAIVIALCMCCFYMCAKCCSSERKNTTFTTTVMQPVPQLFTAQLAEPEIQMQVQQPPMVPQWGQTQQQQPPMVPQWGQTQQQQPYVQQQPYGQQQQPYVQQQQPYGGQQQQPYGQQLPTATAMPMMSTLPAYNPQQQAYPQQQQQFPQEGGLGFK
jgi:hypothetical protein